MARTQKFSRQSEVVVGAQEAFDWHARPGAFARLAPPWTDVRMLTDHPGIEEGTRVELSMPAAGPIRVRWHALHDRCVPGSEFRDIQEKGPFKRWEHTHSFRPAEGGTGGSIIEDSIEYELPLGALGAAVAGGMIRADLERTFTYRHRITRDDLAQHHTSGLAPARIAITGATGLVGSALVPFLTTGGHEVLTVGRAADCDVKWDALSADASQGLDGLNGCDAVIHLAGVNIAGGRWTDSRKEEIRESRVYGTMSLARALARLEQPPKVLVCASAVGFYGDRSLGDGEIDETAEPGTGFLSEVCIGWEEATEPASAAGIRVVHLRLGVVLDARGGALQRMLLPFQLGAGGRLGSGKQPMSWVALDDVLGIVLHALSTDELSGPVNAVAPELVDNAGYTATLAGVLRRPAIAPVPAPVVSTLFGEMGRELLLAGAPVVPGRLSATGYRFRHGLLEDALRHTLGRRPETS